MPKLADAASDKPMGYDPRIFINAKNAKIYGCALGIIALVIVANYAISKSQPHSEEGDKQTATAPGGIAAPVIQHAASGSTTILTQTLTVNHLPAAPSPDGLLPSRDTAATFFSFGMIGVVLRNAWKTIYPSSPEEPKSGPTERPGARH